MKRRELATSLMSRLRVLPLLERFGSRPALAVLVYHRILRPENCQYDSDVIEATPEQFDDQMRMLRKRHDVVGPAEMVELILNPQKIKRLRVGITFDDGYIDNYDNAFPILKSNGLQASFFLPTNLVGTRQLPWWDQIAYLVRNTKRSELTLPYPRTVVVRVDLSSDRTAAIRDVLRAFKQSEQGMVVSKFLEGLEEACDVPLPREAPDRQFLSWEEAAEMQRAGMAIGSHTHSHRILAQLSGDEQLTECTGSRELLQTNKLDADCIAYPVGGPSSFSDETKECVKKAGYRSAFSNYGGMNLPDEITPFDVKRLGMDVHQSTPQLRTRLALSAMARRQVW